MNVEHAFFTCLAMAAIGLILVVVNICAAVTKDFTNRGLGNVFAVHCIALLFYLPGMIGTIGFGIAWALQYLKH
jgi:hypothetical protein